MTDAPKFLAFSPLKSPPRRRDASRAGWREARILVPDTRTEAFRERARRQAQAVAADDPGGRVSQALLDELQVWSDP